MQNISDLKEMTSCHGFAVRALDVLQFLAKTWEVDGIFENTDEGQRPPNDFEPIIILMSQLSPLTGSISMMHNIVPWPSQGEDPALGPFPIQGRPIIGLNSNLEEDGFATLPLHESGIEQ